MVVMLRIGGEERKKRAEGEKRIERKERKEREERIVGQEQKEREERVRIFAKSCTTGQGLERRSPAVQIAVARTDC
jgi:hypothetical protein